ncbi:MAG: FKBP-type peptidyl-prolyl cis-trans isomerase [Actinomycetes bacterium]
MHSLNRSSRRALGAAALLLAATLTACGSPAATPSPAPSESVTATPAASDTATPSPAASPTPVPVSNAIDSITVNGAAGSAPAVSVPAPFAIDETRSSTLSPGTGPEAGADSIVEVNYVGVNARTGATFDSSWERGQPALFSLEQVVPGFTKGLTGAQPGERVLVVMPGSDGYDGSGGNAQAGIEVGDSLVFAIDVLAVSVKTVTGATGTEQPPVTLGDEGGKPTVTIPAGAALPTANSATTMIRGAQRAVGSNDYVMVHYRSWSWKTGRLIEDKFETPDAGQIAETIPGFRDGVVGQPIGSRVVVVAPDAYPTGHPDLGVEAGDTMVYVVDILFSSAVS